MPCYPDLLEVQDNDDESEHGRALITGAAGWRTEMAGWIGAAREADLHNPEEMDHNLGDEELPKLLTSNSTLLHATKWVRMTLEDLFGGLPKWTAPMAAAYIIPAHIQQEMDQMEALADQSEDKYLDDGAQEGSGDDFCE